MAPGLSTVGDDSLIFFSSSLAVLLVGDRDRLGTIGIPFVGTVAGFLRSFRDGGGGASSANPWLLNCEL